MVIKVPSQQLRVLNIANEVILECDALDFHYAVMQAMADNLQDGEKPENRFEFLTKILPTIQERFNAPKLSVGALLQVVKDVSELVTSQKKTTSATPE